jgi:hypothetical protein
MRLFLRLALFVAGGLFVGTLAALVFAGVIATFLGVLGVPVNGPSVVYPVLGAMLVINAYCGYRGARLAVSR